MKTSKRKANIISYIISWPFILLVEAAVFWYWLTAPYFKAIIEVEKEQFISYIALLGAVGFFSAAAASIVLYLSFYSQFKKKSNEYKHIKNDIT